MLQRQDDAPPVEAFAGSAPLSRRAILAGAGAVLATSTRAFGQHEPPSTVTKPPRDFRPGAAPTTYFTDPDVISVDPAFGSYVVPNSAICRLWTGGLWTEGPAWNGVGRYLVWSDIPNDRQMRWLEEDGHVGIFRVRSNNANGNSFDRQGRQLSCEHVTRRVVRYELDGSATVLADRFDGTPFNSPNDIVQHADGSYWFTDPAYGGFLYEGMPDEAGGPSNAQGRLDPRLGQPAGFPTARRVLPNAVYRIDPTGRIDRVLTEDQLPDPNGLCFSPDHKTLYVSSTGKGPGDTGPGGKGEIYAFDVENGRSLANKRLFSDCMVDDVKCGPDGMRADVDGNLWAASNAGRTVGYSGVTVWSPEGQLIGRIRLPEVCANLTFGGPKRNRLFMTASQSLYAVYVNTQGAGPA
ncbi:SMP-30/gluconolactonase/LRE family protein [Methylobacterium sp. NEAU K]|uniref:SMP-30/gluconolactonase/LRE family protein n=1 Tax=Methylobacterium sp. NEAU K TaxID=3064946 RepID=UPI002733C532|nr:SMP-30/gluconolactonase/LRE family protein [Methylobacterium sp. NEAU K]MDP4002582.1 SMP-30/gluconolactonase/LRE family protein [Methylobacterium sp. NEAU K]